MLISFSFALLPQDVKCANILLAVDKDSTGRGKHGAGNGARSRGSNDDGEGAERGA